jgi:hypothetical protein
MLDAVYTRTYAKDAQGLGVEVVHHTLEGAFAAALVCLNALNMNPELVEVQFIAEMRPVFRFVPEVPVVKDALDLKRTKNYICVYTSNVGNVPQFQLARALESGSGDSAGHRQQRFVPCAATDRQ